MKKGFTIIEFMIYISILSVAIAAMGLVSMNVFSVGARTDAIQEVAHNGRFAMHKIGSTINEANSLIIPSQQGSIIQLAFTDPSRNPTTFDVTAGKLRITEAGRSPIDLTTSKVVVDRIFFTRVSNDSIRVEMNISFHNPQNLPAHNFNNFFLSSFVLGR